jgi:amino acid adenylation domain-containing protein
LIEMTPVENKLGNIEAQYPLSFLQQGMLFEGLSAPESGINIEQLICDLHEDLNVSFFKQAWQKVVERHPILRTSFCWEGVKDPFQQVKLQVSIPVEEDDWCGLSVPDAAERLELYLQRDRQRGFQFNEAPLMRLALFRIAQHHYQCVWTFHHILLDGRSFPLILQELFAIYEALCSNQDLQLPQPRPYQDYIDWLYKQDFAFAENFWRSRLNGFYAPTSLTVERNHQLKSDELRYSQQEIRLSETLTSKLRFLASEHQLTFNTLVQGAWALLLSRYSGEEDVVFGATRACRRSAVEGAESMVGLLINTLPLRVQVLGEMPLLQWLKELRSQWISLRDYEHTPLSEIGRWSDIPTGQPLFESILVFENYRLNSKLREQGGKWANREFRLLERTNYPLTVAGYLESEFLLQIEYDRARFDDATITRMLGHIKTLLEGMVTNPGQCLQELPILTAAERHQLLMEWNNTQADYPKHSCIHHLFEAQVEQTPDAVAVVFGEESLTYRELNNRANQLAHYLQSLGVKPDTLVAISVERSLEMIVGFLGILKAGGAYVPLDPAYPHERRAYKLQDSQAPVILTQDRLLTSLPDNQAKVVRLDADWDVIARESQENSVSDATVENLAYVIYTSGSTGNPKGVMITHQGMVNHSVAIAHEYDLKPSDRILQFSSMSFDIIIEEVFPSLIIGAAIILRPEDILASTTNFVQFVERERITVLNLPTAFWHELVKGLSILQPEPAKPKEAVPSALLATVRLLIVGGEKASRSIYLTWLQLVGKRIRWLNSYGPTETTVTATVYDPSSQSDNNPLLSEIPIGRPLANAQAYILDRNLQPVPIGVTGELHIGGAGLGRGYLNRPDLTASKFINNPFIAVESDAQPDNPQSNRLYKTGDAVRYLSDGNIEFIGRIDYQVKIRGFRIELGEIETVLEQHPTVQQAVVLAREDVPGEKRLVAYIVPKQEHTPTTRELSSFLKEKLPDYMVPTAFVMMETLPLTPNGKVDRRALKAPDPSVTASQRVIVPPRYQLEFQLTKIWEEILKIEPIGIRDNFFDLGGHSLLVMRLISQINALCGKTLPLNTLFSAPTIEQLAKFLHQENELASSGSLVPLQPEGSKPPFFCIHEIIGNAIYCQRMARYLPDQPLYGLQPVGLEGKQPPHTQIEQMAAHYIKEMQTIEPNGPYFLGGYSFGGLVAFEMAQQLQAQGKKVALLALFDVPAPGHQKRLLGRWLCKQINYLSKHGFEMIVDRVQEKLRGKEQQEQVDPELLDLIQHLHLDPENLLDQSIELVAKINFQAADDYVFKPYPGKVTLFRAMHEAAPEGWYFDPYLGWGNLAAKGVDLVEIPAVHNRMFDEPDVKVVAEKLRDCLEGIQKQIHPDC